MKRLLFSALLAGGCAAMTEPPEAGAGRCDAEAAETLVGRKANAELGGEALRMTGARALRWLPPGAIVTMDYRIDRLNIELDASNVVTAIRCG